MEPHLCNEWAMAATASGPAGRVGTSMIYDTSLIERCPHGYQRKTTWRPMRLDPVIEFWPFPGQSVKEPR
jgi:hypothetical protein